MIGVFDSGSGGLTVMRAIRERLPSADITYFGDIKNAPYGSKSQEELSRFTISAIELLKKSGATSIVSACNSVSASLAVSLFDTLNILPQHLIEMVGPTVSYFKDSPARLLLLATPATIHSGIYQNGFKMIGKEVVAVSVPDLAGAIEFGASQDEIEKLIRVSLTGVELNAIDVVILACTHYPLVYDTFRCILDPRIHIFDPALAVAERVKRDFWPREVSDAQTRFLISKDSPTFRSFVRDFFPDDAEAIEVIQ